MVLGAIPWAWDWSPAAWAAIGACATFLVYVVIGIYAVRQVGEARRLREEQARPWVVVDFDVNFAAWVTFENIGRTLATDVRVRFDPPLTSTLPQPWSWERSSLLRDGLPSMPPNKQWRLLFDSFPERVKVGTLPMIYDVEVEYLGATSNKPYKTHYKLDLNLDVGAGRPPKGMAELVDTLDSIRAEMSKWTDRHGGLITFNFDREKYVRIEDRQHWIGKAKKVKAEHGWVAFGRYLIDRALQRRGWVPR
ncbi:MAG TPA: hypothetical protein VNA87_06400 [Actinomycetota bacterium]|nr:hypothetical protein [Actinomycetota bacterium]